LYDLIIARLQACVNNRNDKKRDISIPLNVRLVCWGLLCHREDITSVNKPANRQADVPDTDSVVSVQFSIGVTNLTTIVESDCKHFLFPYRPVARC